MASPRLIFLKFSGVCRMFQGIFFFFCFFSQSHPFPLPRYPGKVLSTLRRLGEKKSHFKIFIVHKNLILNSNQNPFQLCTYVKLVSSSPKFTTVSLMTASRFRFPPQHCFWLCYLCAFRYLWLAFFQSFCS